VVKAFDLDIDRKTLLVYALRTFQVIRMQIQYRLFLADVLSSFTGSNPINPPFPWREK